ncbi:hypothetical protein Tco_1278066 [Tanacetum coccineum]
MRFTPSSPMGITQCMKGLPKRLGYTLGFSTLPILDWPYPLSLLIYLGTSVSTYPNFPLLERPRFLTLKSCVVFLELCQLWVCSVVFMSILKRMGGCPLLNVLRSPLYVIRSLWTLSKIGMTIFFWVDEFTCLARFPWHTAKNVTRDPAPKATDFSAQDYAILVDHPYSFRKFPEEFLCLIGLSRHYTLDEETYPSFIDRDGEDMDIFAFIRTPDPTKVKVVERERHEGELRLLEVTVGRTVP